MAGSLRSLVKIARLYDVIVQDWFNIVIVFVDKMFFGVCCLNLIIVLVTVPCLSDTDSLNVYRYCCNI